MRDRQEVNVAMCRPRKHSAAKSIILVILNFTLQVSEELLHDPAALTSGKKALISNDFKPGAPESQCRPFEGRNIHKLDENRNVNIKVMGLTFVGTRNTDAT
jgi:hypothetical protein